MSDEAERLTIGTAIARGAETQKTGTLVAREMTGHELLMRAAKSPWYEIKCSVCGETWAIESRTLEKVIAAYGYVHCAVAACGARLFYRPRA